MKQTDCERMRAGSAKLGNVSKHVEPPPSATGGIARLVCARIRESGIELAPLLTKAGLSIEQIENREARVKVGSQIRFLELSAAASQDDFLGFHVARDFDLREIGLVYYVLASSESLGDAMRKAERYSSVANEGISLRFGARQETAITLTHVGVDRRSDRQHMEFWLTTLVRICRQLTDRRLMPSQVRVAHNRAATPATVRSFLGCEIEFGSNVDQIIFPEAVKLMPIVSADPYLNELLTKYCDEALAHRKSSSTSLRSRVENAIAQLLPHGRARANEIARQLGMSHRSLVRRLALEGLTFSEVLDELRVDLAKSHLRAGKLPISQMAWLLGYREVSSFTHAFKRWTGMTPRQARKKAATPSPLSARNGGSRRPHRGRVREERKRNSNS